jgi:DNA-binding LacI/PurR family transcriptional regulator
MSTVKDVARLAGVNVSTVSRYLSGKLSVTPKTEKRILKAIKETNYQPNIIAQSLRSGSSKTIAVVAPDIYQPGISEIIYGVDDRIRETDYLLMTIMTQNSASRERAILTTLCHMMVGGVIIIGQPADTINSMEEIQCALGGNTPIMFVSRNFEESEVPEICPDQEDGVRMLTEHLLIKGYRSIGLIVGVQEHPDAKKKIAGYQRGLKSQGVPFNADLIVQGFYQAENTRNAVKDLINKDVEAIICASDLMAIAAMKFIQDQGLSIPGDIAVAGYGGTAWADMVSPRLTTVNVQVNQLGGLATEYLLQQIQGKEPESNFQILPVSLRVGEST